eukprot:scaffold232065_cov39-Prasinocladus_malaysianus.AAC.1
MNAPAPENSKWHTQYKELQISVASVVAMGRSFANWKLNICNFFTLVHHEEQWDSSNIIVSTIAMHIEAPQRASRKFRSKKIATVNESNRMLHNLNDFGSFIHYYAVIRRETVISAINDEMMALYDELEELANNSGKKC